MMADPATRKVCSTAGCGVPLRSDNESGLCTACRKGVNLKERPPSRICSAPGCGHALGAGNKSGVCSPCQGHGSGRKRVKPPPRPADHFVDPLRKHIEAAREPSAGELRFVRKPAPSSSGSGPIGERFRRVTEALGYEPDDVLEPVMQAWLDRVDAAAVADQQLPKQRKRKADAYSLAGDDDE